MLKYVGLWVKLLLSVGLLVFVVSRIDISLAIKFFLQPTTAYGVVAAVGALILQGILAARRQVVILELLGHRLTFHESLRAWFSGLFVTQVAVTFIAGDVVRGMLFVSNGVPRRAASRAIILDRVVGFAVLLVMVDVVLPFIAAIAPDSNLHYSLLLIAAAATVGLLALFLGVFARRFFEILPGQIARYRPVEIAIDLAGVSRFLFKSDQLFPHHCCTKLRHAPLQHRRHRRYCAIAGCTSARLGDGSDCCTSHAFRALADFICWVGSSRSRAGHRIRFTSSSSRTGVGYLHRIRTKRNPR